MANLTINFTPYHPITSNYIQLHPITSNYIQLLRPFAQNKKARAIYCTGFLVRLFEALLLAKRS